MNSAYFTPPHRIPAGNYFEMAVKLSQLTWGHNTQSSIPFTPEPGDRFQVTLLQHGGKGYRCSNVSINGTTLTFSINGDIAIGLYSLEIIVTRADHKRLRSLQKNKIEIVFSNEEAGIPDNDEFQTHTITLGGAILMIVNGTEFQWDQLPTQGSGAAVESGGIYAWFKALCDANGLIMPGTFIVTLPSTPEHYTIQDTTTKSVSANSAYQNRVTPASNYEVEVTVTMGGVDITSTAYNNGVINIAQVTGNIVISVTAHALTFTITTHSSFAGFTPRGYSSPVNRGSNITIYFDKTTGYNLSQKPYAKMGSTTIQSTKVNDDLYQLTINGVSANIVLYGLATAENRTFYGEYTQPNEVTAALIKTGSVVSSGIATPTINSNSFFIAYPTGHFPSSVQNALLPGIYYTENDTENSQTYPVTYEGQSYVIWVLKTDYENYPVGSGIIITL